MAKGNVKVVFNAIFDGEGRVTGASDLRLVGDTAVVFGPILVTARCPPPPPPKNITVTITVDSSTDINVEVIGSGTS